MVETPDLATVEAISPIRKARLKVVLNILKNQGFAKEESGRLKLLRLDLTPPELARLTVAQRDRDERDRLRQQQVIDYAEARACRWDQIVSYFG